MRHERLATLRLSLTRAFVRRADDAVAVPVTRIVHVTDFYLPRLGGIETHVRDLAVRQRDAGHEVEVITTSPALDGNPGADGELLIHRLTNRLWLPVELRPSVLGAARALLRDREYDVVHVHAGPASPLAFAAAARAADTPTVVTAHSVLAGLEPVFRVLDIGLGWSRWPVVWTAVSEVAAAPLRRLVAPDPVYVLSNGIDVAQWRMESRPPGGEGVLIVAVMRLAARKRPRQLLRILRRTRRALPATTGLRAMIAGDGPLRPSLERYLQRHGMTDWVQMPGSLSREQIKDLLARGDIFVAPAILESFGIAALEARCAGLPVVARAEGGIGEFINDGQEGILVDSDAAMVDAIVALAADPAMMARMATHNRTTSPSMLWPEVLARTTELYGLAAARARLVGMAG